MPKAWIDIQKEWCKGCGLCITACKKEALQFADTFNSHGYHPIILAKPEKCTGCMACALVCPDAAIEVYRTKNTTGEKGHG